MLCRCLPRYVYICELKSISNRIFYFKVKWTALSENVSNNNWQVQNGNGIS